MPAVGFGAPLWACVSWTAVDTAETDTSLRLLATYIGLVAWLCESFVGRARSVRVRSNGLPDQAAARTTHLNMPVCAA